MSTALYLQGRQISQLKESQKSIKEADRNIPAKTLQAEIKGESISPAASLTGEDEERYKAKIKKLQSQIAGMQAWQDYLEANQKVDEEDIESASSNQPIIHKISDAEMDKMMRRSYSSRFEEFIKENNYSPEVKEKLLDLYIARQNRMRNAFPPGSGFSGSISQEEVVSATIAWRCRSVSSSSTICSTMSSIICCAACRSGEGAESASTAS